MFQSNFFTTLAAAAIMALSAACSKSKDKAVTPTVETKTYSNLYAPQQGAPGQEGGAFTKFSFSKQAIVTDDAWDIAFRGSLIIVNGGKSAGVKEEPPRVGSGAVSIVVNTFDAVKELPDAATFKQDAENAFAIPIGSGKGWYNYDGTTHIMSPIAGKVFVIKTNDGKYAKMEILSYYKDAPAKPESSSPSRYYTFRYVYQPNGTTF